MCDLSALTRFLGGSPLAVFIKLLVASLIVGAVMSAFGWSPYDVVDRVVRSVRRVWAMGFDAFGDILGYVMLGAGIVLPIFIVLRLLSYRKG